MAQLNEIKNLMERINLIGGTSDSLRKKFTNYSSIDEILTEGYHQSYSAENMLSILLRHYDIGYEENFLGKNQIGIAFDAYKETENKYGSDEVSVIILVIKNGFEDLDKIKKFFDTCGWTLASTETYYKNYDYTIYVFEKNKQTDVLTTNKYLYHLTPTSKLNKIYKNGLTPHSGNKISKHPERIYLFLNKNLKANYVLFANDLWIEDVRSKGAKRGVSKEEINNIVNKGRDNKYALLQIDVDKCKNDFKVYGDPNLNKAVWTFDNIPPEAIKIIYNDI